MTKAKSQKAVSSFLNKNITVGSLNIQGGFKTKSKLDDFENLVKNCHIFCLQETWLENQEAINVSGFEHFRSERVKNKRARRNSGGILIFYRESILKGIEKQSSADKHFIWVKLDSKFFKLDGYFPVLCIHTTRQLNIFSG